MRQRPVDNFELDRWRQLDSADVLRSLAEYAKQDISYVPRASTKSTRWHVTAGGSDFELLCTGPKFLNTRAGTGGGGAIDLAMHILNLEFKQAVRILQAKGI